MFASSGEGVRNDVSGASVQDDAAEQLGAGAQQSPATCASSVPPTPLTDHDAAQSPSARPSAQTARVPEVQNPQNPIPGRTPIPENVKFTAAGRGGVSDYSDIYPEDPYGAEAGENARVWRVYLDESGQFDDDMLQGFRDSLDVHLIFAALFSAVVTTFVVQTSLVLQPDYGRISAALLLELVALQRANSPSDVPRANVDLDSVYHTSGDVWVNALWFTTLALCLAMVLIAAVVKQWLQDYVKTPPGTPRDRALIRHMRYKELLKWRVPFIISIIPLLLHVSLALFLAGLVIFLYALSATMSFIVAGITGATSAFYIVTHILAVVNWQCSYKTPVTHMLRLITLANIYYFLSSTKDAVRDAVMTRIMYVAGYTAADLFTYGTWAHIPATLWNLWKFRFARPPKPASREELHAVSIDNNVGAAEKIMFDALHWLVTNSTNPSADDIVFEAFSGWPAPLCLDVDLDDDWVHDFALTSLKRLHARVTVLLGDERGCIAFERWSRSFWSILQPWTWTEGAGSDVFNASPRAPENVVYAITDKAVELASTMSAPSDPQLVDRLRAFRTLLRPSLQRPDPFLPAVEQTRRYLRHPGTELSLSLWMLLLHNACRASPGVSVHSFLLVPPDAVAPALGSITRLRTALANAEIIEAPEFATWLDDTLDLVRVRCTSGMHDGNMPLQTPAKVCEGGFTLRDACTVNQKISGLLEQHVCSALGYGTENWRENRWHQALTFLVVCLEAMRRPIPLWLAQHCLYGLPIARPRWGWYISRRVHRLCRSPDTPIDVINEQVKQDLETFFILSRTALTCVANFYHAQAASYLSVSLCVFLREILDMTLKLHADGKAEPLLTVLTICHQYSLLDFWVKCLPVFVTIPAEALPDVCLRYPAELMHRYIHAVLLYARQPGDRSDPSLSPPDMIGPLLSDRHVEWMARISYPLLDRVASMAARRLRDQTLAAYDDALRQLYQHTSENPVWNRALVTLVADIHTRAGMGGGYPDGAFQMRDDYYGRWCDPPMSSVMEVQSKCIWRFVTALQCSQSLTEPCHLGDCADHVLYAYVTVKTLLRW
ncbi:hypothetical protein EV121DRAFT_287105 [Schizophyllum commune]